MLIYVDWPLVDILYPGKQPPSLPLRHLPAIGAYKLVKRGSIY